MLHDLIGKPKDELDDFLAEPNNHLILTGGIWRHKHRLTPSGGTVQRSVSLAFDKYFDTAFKQYIRSKAPKNGAFARKSIFRLLEGHAAHKFVLRADIRKYFPSITFNVVSKYAKDSADMANYSKHINDVFFYGNSLRKGLVSAPVISEIVGMAIDGQSSKLMYELGLRDVAYSRYYDDLVFSSNSRKDLETILQKLPALLRDSFGLELNNKKTRISLLHGERILGLVFFNGDLSVPKEFKNRLRATEYLYDSMGEAELEEVWAKLSQVGTIIASHHRILINSTRDESKYERSLHNYYDELYRLQNLRDELLRKEYELMS